MPTFTVFPQELLLIKIFRTRDLNVIDAIDELQKAKPAKPVVDKLRMARFCVTKYCGEFLLLTLSQHTKYRDRARGN